MISILIPVYNVDVSELVKTLDHQLTELNIVGEIIVFDDFSKDEIKRSNANISAYTKVIYKELNKNHGRIEIRNLLAQTAFHNYLLFIDCDSKILKQNFLKTYLTNIEKGFEVIAGGTKYQATPPECIKKLHWKYGSEREVITTNKKSFRTNNFCIKKSVFQQINIPVAIQGYGHEDTWLGIELDHMKVKVAYIDNAVLHNGLEENKVFIEKSLNALKNLKNLSQLVNDNLLVKHVSLFKTYKKFQDLHLNKIILLIYAASKNIIYKNITSCNPSLKLFDFYRLAYFILLMKRRED